MNACQVVCSFGTSAQRCPMDRPMDPVVVTGAGLTPPRSARSRGTAPGSVSVRLNQLAAGGSGVGPGILKVLVDVINQGLLAPVHSLGGIGTGDLTALASTALCLLGERSWRGGTLSPYPMD